MLCALPISAVRGGCSPIKWGSCGAAIALLSSLSSTAGCCERKRKNFRVVDRKRFPVESSACAGCRFLREPVQAPSSWPAYLVGHISPPACSSPLSHQAPATFSIPSDDFKLLPVHCLQQSLPSVGKPVLNPDCN